MFIKKWQLIFLYIGRTDWGTRHLTIIVGTGAGHLPTKIAQWAGHLTNFFKCTGFTRWFSRRMLAARMDSYIKTSKKRSDSFVFPMEKNLLVQYYQEYAVCSLRHCITNAFQLFTIELSKGGVPSQASIDKAVINTFFSGQPKLPVPKPFHLNPGSSRSFLDTGDKYSNLNNDQPQSQTHFFAPKVFPALILLSPNSMDTTQLTSFSIGPLGSQVHANSATLNAMYKAKSPQKTAAFRGNSVEENSEQGLCHGVSYSIYCQFMLEKVHFSCVKLNKHTTCVRTATLMLKHK